MLLQTSPLMATASAFLEKITTHSTKENRLENLVTSQFSFFGRKSLKKMAQAEKCTYGDIINLFGVAYE